MAKTATPINPILSERIRAERKAHKLTQAELAERIGISDQTIRLYETNRRGVSLRTVTALAECFGCQPEYLTGESEFREKDIEVEFYSQILPPIKAAVNAARNEMMEKNQLYVNMLQMLFSCKVKQYGVDSDSNFNYAGTVITDPGGKKYGFESLDEFLAFMDTFVEEALPHLFWRFFMYPSFVREYTNARKSLIQDSRKNSECLSAE